MSSAKTIQIEVGYEDDGEILFVGIDKEDIPLILKALAYQYEQEQGEKKEITPDDALRLHRIYKQLQWENPKITQEEFWEEVVRRFKED